MLEQMLAAVGSPDADISDAELDEIFTGALKKALDMVPGGPVAVIPPDATRFHSRAGFLCDCAARTLQDVPGDRLGIVLPALGTHMAMTEAELKRMFPATPLNRFRVHDWRNEVVELGRVDAEFVSKASEGAVDYDYPAQVNKALRDDGYSMLLSLGQVVPHEVVGMANHLKNIFVGCGGKEAIDKSHFTGAVYGMERMMGRSETPVRALFDEAYRRFGSAIPPVLYALTVVGNRSKEEALRTSKPGGSLAVRGLFIGFGRECFVQAAALSRMVNVDILDRPIKKAVVYLEPEEFRTTWLGNKAVYRTRMAMEDGGELIIMAPGLERFGEDMEIDALIRKHGYRPGKEILRRVSEDPALADALSAAAHLIHGSSEGRFTVRYCPGPAVSKAEIESVGYEWGDLEAMQNRYRMEELNLGWNRMDDGEEIFFVPNPALGLWAEKKRFNASV